MSSISKVMANLGIIVRAKNVSIAPGEKACNKKLHIWHAYNNYAYTCTYVRSTIHTV